MIEILQLHKYYLWGYIYLFVACSSHYQRSVQDSRSQQNIHHKLLILTEEIFECDLSVFNQSLKGPLSPFAMLLNQERLSSAISKDAHKVSSWLDWIEAHNGDLALTLEPSQSVIRLERERTALIVELEQLKRGIRKPPLRVWFSESPEQRILDTLPGSWLQLNQRHIRRVNQSKQAKINSYCSHSLTMLQDLRHKASHVLSLRQKYETERLPGLRLLRAPRPKMSENCRELFGLKSQTLPKQELTGDGVGWHLVLKKLSAHRGRDQSIKYLTIAVPAEHDQIPIWIKEKSILGQLWTNRHLWWGAQACWHRVDLKTIEAPIPSQTLRWVHRLSYAKDDNVSMLPKVYKVEASRWGKPLTRKIALTKEYALEYEFVHKVSLDIKGIVTSVMRPQEIIVQRLSTPLPLGLWMGELNQDNKPVFSAYFMGILSPYVPYEILLQLQGGRKLFNLAYERKSLAPLVLVLSPKMKRDRAIEDEWKSLLTAYSEQASELQKGDLLSTEITPVNAWRLLNEPSVLISQQYGVTKERLKRYLFALPDVVKSRLYLPGRTLTVNHGVWFGTQSLSNLVPLEQMP